MGGLNGLGWWVSYASDDFEAWKCIGLARALRRTLTTRPFMVIASNQVRREISFLLQDEVDKVYFSKPVENLSFRSLAKLKLQQLMAGERQQRFVLLDCNCLPIKNCDDLFRLNGVQWSELGETGEEFAAIVANSTLMRDGDLDTVMRLVVGRETLKSGLYGNETTEPALNEINYCFELDMKRSWNDYRDIMQKAEGSEKDLCNNMRTELGPLTAKISYFLELIGPSYSTESGCSTSIEGVDMACDKLRNEACDLAIVLGANLLLDPFTPGIVEGSLAPNGRCETVDASTDEIGRAEGVGVLILKRLSDAVSNGDRIWGVIRSSAVVGEGKSRTMGTSTANVETNAMQLALERAWIHPDDVDFVEPHGTIFGDPIELAAISKAYSSPCRDKLIIGSAETNIGHTESVSGIAGIQKTLLSMHHNLIPRHLHITKLNPEIDLTAIPAELSMQAIPWERKMCGKPRIAGINSFGITGAQAHLILEEPPQTKLSPVITLADSRQHRILTFSAKTETALQAQLNLYKDLLEPSKNVSLEDMEYTMHTSRTHFPVRQVVVGSTNENIISSLESLQKPKQIPGTPPRLCFLFTGQGSQYGGMAKSLYFESVVFRSTFDWCDSVLSLEYGLNIKRAILEDEFAHLLSSTLYSQIGIFCVEFGLLRLWESWGVIPEAVMGHSLGEFVAAVAAGMLKPLDALKMVATRSKLINVLPSSGMLVVARDLGTCKMEMSRAFGNSNQYLDIAAVNSQQQTVVSGSHKMINEFKIFCENNGITTLVLDSSHAFHSKLMDPIERDYDALLSSVKFRKPSKCKFISGVEGRIISEVDKNYWWRHTREKVCFLQACKSAGREGLTMFLEIGPHPVLSAFVLKNLHEISEISAIPSIRRKSNDWETMLSSVGKLYTCGISINWNNFHRYSSGKIIEVPGNHFEETRH